MTIRQVIQIQESIKRSLTKHQQSGDSNDMLGLRLSGMIEGLQLVNELNDQQALEIIIAMKNHFNF